MANGIKLILNPLSAIRKLNYLEINIANNFLNLMNTAFMLSNKTAFTVCISVKIS